MSCGFTFDCAPLAFPLILFSVFAGDGKAQKVPPLTPEGSQDSQQFQISVEVDLVVLHASVRDQKGWFASDLHEQDFEVYEDGARQSIHLFQHEDIPVTVGLVVDHSGSMRNKLADVVAAARTFVNASSPEDQMFVVNFNENVTLGLPDSIRLSNRADELARAIGNTPVTGKTALYDAVAVARERLREGTREKKVLIVISDGGDNASRHTLAEVLAMAGQSGVLVYTIGIFDPEDSDKNPDVLMPAAFQKLPAEVPESVRSDMKDAIDAMRSELKDWSTKLEKSRLSFIELDFKSTY